MQRKEISNSGHYATNEREKARMTENNGQKGYSKKSGKASSRRRRRQGNERVNAGKKQRGGQPRPVFKISDHLSEEIIKRLKAIK